MVPMKLPVHGKIFTTREELIDAANKSLRQFDANFWQAGFDKLIERYQNCILLDGEYVERASNQHVGASGDMSDSDSDW